MSFILYFFISYTKINYNIVESYVIFPLTDFIQSFEKYGDRMSDLKIIIANKKSTVRGAVKKALQSFKMDLKIVGTTDNGETLYSMILETQAELVITDITLAAISGLEVIGKIRKKGLLCKFILITDCKNFECVRQALKYHVEDYLPQVFHPNDLLNALRDASGRIRLRQNHHTIHEPNAASRLLFLKRDINDLKKKPKTISQINQSYGTYFENGQFRTLILKMDCPSNIMSVFENDDFRNRLIQITSVYLNEYCYDILFDRMSDGVLTLINYPPHHSARVSAAIENLFEKSREVFHDVHGIRITLCVSKEYSSTIHLSEAKFEVLDARWARMDVGTNKIIYWSDILKGSDLTCEQIEKFQKLSNQIIHSYEVLDIQKSTEYLNEFFRLARSFLGTREARIFTRKMIDHLFNLYFNLVSSNNEAENLKHEFIYLVNMASSYDKVEEIFLTHMARIMNQISNNVKVQYSRPVREAITYISKHYNSRISLSDVAEEIKLSPTYLSALFKKETGNNFSDYITTFRIDMAKKLLENGDKNISEIAFAVGYNDGLYFSKIFKKCVGVSPKEYKKIYC